MFYIHKPKHVWHFANVFRETLPAKNSPTLGHVELAMQQVCQVGGKVFQNR